jgi:hypothetical protein
MKVFLVLALLMMTSLQAQGSVDLPGVTSVTRKDWYTFPYDLSSLVFTFSFLGCGNSEFHSEATPKKISKVSDNKVVITEIAILIKKTTSFQCTMPHWLTEEVEVSTKQIEKMAKEKVSVPESVDIEVSNDVKYKIENPFTLI